MMSRWASLFRLTVFLLAAILGYFGWERAGEGWRLEPLDAYIHASWWAMPQTARPPEPSVWRPSTGDGRAWASYSQVLLEHANQHSDPAQVSAATIEAKAATARSLALAPAQSAAWARLALLELNGGRHAAALSALDLSLRTGKAAKGLIWLRAKLGLFLWSDLPMPAQSGIEADIRRVWWLRPSVDLLYPREALVRFAHSLGRLDAVRGALPSGEQALLAEQVQSVLMEIAGES